MGKTKIKTHASNEAMRWADDAADVIARGPSENGNIFDVSMSEEADGMVAAKKIVDAIKKQGICVTQANAPHDLLMAAYEEAESLWDDGLFGPPLRVYDDRSMLEAQLWNQALVDEQKVVWLKDTEAKGAHMVNALRLLAKNMADFGGGLGELLSKEVGVSFDRYGHAMLSCYTGDRQYKLHLDNPHGDEEDDEGPIDNGMRLTMAYYINPMWKPAEGKVEGGLDVYLSDPTSAPSSAGAAKKSPKFRIAPQGDTLSIFLSERMAHEVLPTKGNTKWFCLTMWCLDGKAMQQMSRKLVERNRRRNAKDSDDEDD